jgi:hypothetical protein
MSTLPGERKYLNAAPATRMCGRGMTGGG